MTTLLKIKVLHNAIEEPFCLNGSIKNLYTSEEPLYHKRFFVAKEGSLDDKVRKRWFFKEPLTEWFFVEQKRVILWHCLKILLKHIYF